MLKTRRLSVFLIALFLGASVLASAEGAATNATATKGEAPGSATPLGATPLSHRVLPNGLEVFVVENHAVPLVTLSLVFRGGAIAHRPETAGLFHLYEHLLFAGNERYPSQAAFTAALNRMGVPNWNGSTGREHIDYYITLPSSRLAEGIEFWSWAAMKPLFSPEKLESEKEVVINEIRGYHTDPDQVMENAFESRLYPEHPWRRNIDGPEENIRKASLADLEAMRRTYYIPANTALLLGGDLDPEEAFALAQRYFGAWTGGSRPVIGEPAQGAFPEGVRLVYSDDSFYRGVAQVQFRWRGPDVMRNTKDTYAADVLLFLLSSPVGRFKTALMEKGSGLYDPEYIDFSYPTARDGGAFYFNTFLLLGDPSRGSVIDRSEALQALILEEFELIQKDPEAYFPAGELERAKTKLIDQNLLSMETASSFLKSVRFWWSVATTDYFLGYEEACAEVGWEDISELIRRYITGGTGKGGSGAAGVQAGRPASGRAVRFASSALFGEADIAERMKAQGYEVLSPDSAFWWQIRGGQK